VFYRLRTNAVTDDFKTLLNYCSALFAPIRVHGFLHHLTSVLEFKSININIKQVTRINVLVDS